MDTQSEIPKPVDVVKQSSPETEAAATTAMWLEIIFGFFGLLGMGHVYSGRTRFGIAWMIGWWVYIAITTIVLWRISLGLALFIFGALGLVVPIISGLQARMYIQRVGGRGNWQSVGFLSWIIITTCVILAATTKHQNYDDNFTCNGRTYDLGVGFPVSFLCDYGGSGGSPLDSWHKVDLADFPYFSLQGLLIDGSIYLIITFSIAWVARYIYHKHLHPFEIYGQMALMTIAFAIGFFFATFVIAPDQEYQFQNYFYNSQKPFDTPLKFSLHGLLIGSLLGLTIALDIAWAVRRIYRKDLPPFRPYKQMVLINVTFSIGFVFAVFIINSNFENFQNYINELPIPTTVPSPTDVPFPTPYETMSPSVTPPPIATSTN